MKHFAAFLLLTAVAWADPPAISSPQLEIPDPNLITVPVGNPPQVDLFVTDPPEGSRQTWTGPLDKDQPGRRTLDGVSHSTSLPGRYQYRCVIQTPLPEFDDLQILDITIVVTGTGPKPDPEPEPDPDPTPTPEPDLPDGKYGLAKPSYRAAMQAMTSKRDEEATAIAVLLLGATREASVQAMKDKFESDLNSQFTDAQWTAWTPWIEWFGRDLNRLQLTSTDDAKVAFVECSLGLFAVGE